MYHLGEEIDEGMIEEYMSEENMEQVASLTTTAMASQVQNMKTMLSSPAVREQMRKLGINVNVQTIPTQLIINALAVYGLFKLGDLFKSKNMALVASLVVGYMWLNKSKMVDKAIESKTGIAPSMENDTDLANSVQNITTQATMGFGFNR